MGELNSTLIEMVQTAADAGSLLQLESLSYQPGWSAFVQYLAHTYRQIGNHEQFAAQVEQVLRGTLGFQSLRKSHKGWADSLVQGVYAYAERIKGKPLSLVDATGFSWESVNATLARLGQENLPNDVWSPELFAGRRDDLRRMMGLLLQVPELQDSLKDVTGGTSPDGDKLAQIICAWVQGRPLIEMAADYFSQPGEEESDEAATDPVTAMTKCCQSVFGRLTQTASWGLSALQSLTLGNAFDELSPDEQRSLRNLPARVYYGVNSDEAVALRLLGVPRTAAPALAMGLAVKADEPLHQVRGRLRAADVSEWTRAMGERGASYHRVQSWRASLETREPAHTRPTPVVSRQLFERTAGGVPGLQEGRMIWSALIRTIVTAEWVFTTPVAPFPRLAQTPTKSVRIGDATVTTSCHDQKAGTRRFRCAGRYRNGPLPPANAHRQ